MLGYLKKERLATPWKVVYFPSSSIIQQGASMTTIMPQTDLTRKAIAWISEEQSNGTDKKLIQLIEEAAVRFNLGPKDEDFLHRFYKENKG